MASTSDLAGALAQRRMAQKSQIYEEASSFNQRTQLSQQEFLQKLKVADYEATRMRAKINAENFRKVELEKLQGAAAQWGVFNPMAETMPPEYQPFADAVWKGQEEGRKMAGIRATAKAFAEGPGALSPEESAFATPLEINRIGDLNAEREARDLERELGPVLASAGGDPDAILNDPRLASRLDAKTAEKLSRLSIARKNLRIAETREGRLTGAQEFREFMREREFDFKVEQAEERAAERAEQLRLAKERVAIARKWFDRAMSNDQKREAEQDLDNARKDLNLKIDLITEMEGNPYLRKEGKEALRAILNDVSREVVKYGPGEPIPAVEGKSGPGFAETPLGEGLGQTPKVDTTLPINQGPPGTRGEPQADPKKARIRELLKKGDNRTPAEDQEFLDLTGPK